MHQKIATIFFPAFLVMIMVFPECLLAQVKGYDLEFRSAVYGGTESALPFWLHTNRDGTVDSSSTNWINEIGFRADVFDYGNLSVDMGANLIGRISKHSSAHFSELYVHTDLGGYRLSVGRFPDPIGLNNHELSIGSMMVSRNATPIPKISISTPEFLDVPFTNGYLQYKGMFSHGWLEEDRFVSNTLLHQKYLYLKVNIGKISAVGGAVHNVMWGGKHSTFGQLPDSFRDFLRVITGRSADPGSTEAPPELGNVLGNSLAAYEFGLSYSHKNYAVNLTRLFYLEDKVSTRFRSPWDGVWGINFKFKEKNGFLDGLTYEHINTRQQDAKDDDAIGRANYYNNLIYQTGWSYFNWVIGIPLFNFNPAPGVDQITNNIIIGHHLGINGSINKSWDYTLFLTYTRNYGINPDKLPAGAIDFASRRADQYSFFLEAIHDFPGIKNLALTMALAADTGQFYEDQIGMMLGIRWGN